MGCPPASERACNLAADERPNVAGGECNRDGDGRRDDNCRKLVPEQTSERDLVTKDNESNVLQALDQWDEGRDRQDQNKLCATIKPRGWIDHRRKQQGQDQPSDQFGCPGRVEPRAETSSLCVQVAGGDGMV